jgi:hypothetical protein
MPGQHAGFIAGEHDLAGFGAEIRHRDFEQLLLPVDAAQRARRQRGRLQRDLDLPDFGDIDSASGIECRGAVVDRANACVSVAARALEFRAAITPGARIA